MKKFLGIIFCLFFNFHMVFADFARHYELGQQYLSQFQYSSAILEFRSALRINYLDNSARVGLINSYLARGTYYANNEKDWEAAANDYRAALFYLKYYSTQQDAENSTPAIANATYNLNTCLSAARFSNTPQSRYQKAKELRENGNFAEAGYEFAQTLTEPLLRKSSLEQLADIMKILGNDPKAADYYQKAVAMDDSDPGLRLKYARVLDRLGQSDLAVQEYNFALSRCNDDPEILFALERIYRQKLMQTPNDAEVMANLGAILQKQNKFDEALQYYTQSGQLNPSNFTTRINVGTLYQQKKNYDAAIAAYDSVLVLYPDNKEANLFKAQCLAAKGVNSEAVSLYKKVLNMDPTNQEIKNQIVELLKTTMTPSEMLSYLQKELMSDSGALDTMYSYAIELHKQKKYDDAILFYQEVLKSRASNPEIYVNLAICYRQKNDLKQALLVLQNAKNRFPANKQIIDNIASLQEEESSTKIEKAYEYYKNNDFQNALSAYMEINPPTFESLSGMAICYKSLNNNDKAIELYKKAFDLDASNSDVAYYIGVLYSEKEDWANAKFYLKKALSINKENIKAQDLYQSVVEQANIKLMDTAISYYEKADYINSQRIINQILTDDAKNAYAYYYRGLINDEYKKYALALADYKKAIQYSPELTVVYYLMALDYDALMQYKNALLNYKKYVSVTSEENEYKKYSLTRIKELKQYE